MFASFLIKNICFFINVLVIKYLRSSNECSEKFFPPPPPDTIDAPEYVQFLADWLPWIILFWIEIDFFRRQRRNSRNNFMDAALIIQTLLLCTFALLVVAADGLYHHVYGTSNIINNKVRVDICVLNVILLSAGNFNIVCAGSTFQYYLREMFI